MFYNNENFDFVQSFEKNWKKIYSEYLAIRTNLVDWPEKNLYNGNWEVFGLFDWPTGKELTDNSKHCPFTTELIKKSFKNSHGAAGFSRLMPKTKISPHTGYKGKFLRAHLGLEIPEGDCHLQVCDEKRKWNQGNMLIFDDKLLHSAWNLTDKERIVLLIDFYYD